ncbi:hypothetical protein C0Q70_06806 [Pomacea canaliculata]|uniref:Sushi domain-containing protein n=1 Tax=Pomacea canaliculata TaxID=400727 RepID=A0A2T7PDA1_POMCA|nr:uncharacterized protein LOC112562869 [Pomacea canaliculata]PVD31394.1 hypothetical protein C0Q70_06806 [Pomacea canaliculata]
MACHGLFTTFKSVPTLWLLCTWVLSHLCTCNPVRCTFPPPPSTQSYASSQRGDASDAASLYHDIASISGEVAAPPSGRRPQVPDGGSVNTISTCPWHYEPQDDATRFPRRILRANLTYSEGSYGYCLKRGPSGWELSDLMCIPIIRHVHVLRCSVISGQPRYAREWLPVPIAYTCAFTA